VSRGQRGGSPTAVNPFSRPEPLLFFHVAPHFCSQGSVDPVPDPYSVNMVAPGMEAGTSGCVARNSGHYTTEAVRSRKFLYNICRTVKVKKSKAIPVTGRGRL
jgi:hypothetical protein